MRRQLCELAIQGLRGKRWISVVGDTTPAKMKAGDDEDWRLPFQHGLPVTQAQAGHSELAGPKAVWEAQAKCGDKAIKRITCQTKKHIL